MSNYKTTHLPPEEIDRLRFKAFATNKRQDIDAYYKATSLYFQERHERDMNTRADLAGPVTVKPISDIFHDEQVRIWSDEIVATLAMDDLLTIKTYDDKVRMYRLIQSEIRAIGKAVAELAALEPAAEPAGEPYLVWSNQHRCWWRQDSCGYTKDVKQAGIYSRSKAVSISHENRLGWSDDDTPEEIPVRLADLPEWARAALKSSKEDT